MVGHRSRGSSRGWSPDHRGCPGSQASRHPRRGGHPVAPQWSWPILVVSWRLALRTNCFVPVWPNGCSAEVGSLTAAWRRTPSPCRRPGCGFAHLLPAEHRYKGIPAISACHLAKKEAFQRGRWTAPTIATSSQLRCPLAEKGSFPKGTLATPTPQALLLLLGVTRLRRRSRLHLESMNQPFSVNRSTRSRRWSLESTLY